MLKIDVEKSIYFYYWFIRDRGFVIAGQNGCKTESEAREVAAEFINRCLTDRETWPEEYR